MKNYPLGLATLVLICSVWPAQAQEKVIVGHSARAALSIGPLLYGIERGFYRDEGIDLVYVSIRADLGIKALLSGDIDYSYSTGTIIRGAIIGVPVRNLSFDFSRVLHALMSRPEIPNAAALKGKKVGVSSFGATGDLAARVGLRSLGLDPEKDVTIITLGSDTLRHAALLAGTVQATHMPVPLNIQLKKEGYHELVYAGKILQRPLTGLATSLEKIRKNPAQVQRMVRAFLRATRALKTERAGFIAFAQKKYGYSKEIMEEAYNYLIEALSQDGFVDGAALQAAIDEAKNLAKITKPISQSDVVDYSFLRAATNRLTCARAVRRDQPHKPRAHQQSLRSIRAPEFDPPQSSNNRRSTRLNRQAYRLRWNLCVPLRR
jgi:ABC-type nitrate/sulfonate/bicarbonate transport system substrate-binding protein